MYKLPKELQCEIFSYLDKEVLKIKFLNKEFNQLFNLEKNNISYQILKKYNSNTIYVDSWIIFKYAIENNIQIFDKKINTHPLFYVICTAIQDNCLEIIKYFIKLGVDINKCDCEGWSYLMIALHYNSHLKFIKIFVENGADVNYKNYDDNSILIIAAEYGSKDCIKYLIDNGADVNYYNEYCDNSPLIKATEREHFDIVKLLLENGADINYDDSKEVCKMIYAASNQNDLDFIIYLVEKIKVFRCL